MTVTDTLARTDWTLLAEQKLTLLESIHLAADRETADLLTGLLHWLDAIQDAAHDAGFTVIFLTSDKP